ncbi:MAG: hypothetical protein U0559_10305 [Anaerolineae bacterium]
MESMWQPLSLRQRSRHPRDPRNPSGLQIVGRQSIAVPQPPSDKFKLGTTRGSIAMSFTLVWGTRSALRLSLIVAIQAR